MQYQILVGLSIPSGRPLAPLMEEDLKGKVSTEIASVMYKRSIEKDRAFVYRPENFGYVTHYNR